MTKPTSANVRRPKGYAPLPVNGTEGAAPCSLNDQALLHRAPARNAARVTLTRGCWVVAAFAAYVTGRAPFLQFPPHCRNNPGALIRDVFRFLLIFHEIKK